MDLFHWEAAVLEAHCTGWQGVSEIEKQTVDVKTGNVGVTVTSTWDILRKETPSNICIPKNMSDVCYIITPVAFKKYRVRLDLHLQNH